MIHDDELNEVIRKLDLAKSISEWHFRDAVRELLEECEANASMGLMGLIDEEEGE